MPSFKELYNTKRALSTRQFKARGGAIIRCESCQLSIPHCICQYKPNAESDCEFILIMHHDEIFKPTNTGRLIGDTFPKQTQMFCWDRTQPDPALVSLLNEPTRQCYLLFPEDNSDQNTLLKQPNGASNKPTRARFTRVCTHKNNKTKDSNDNDNDNKKTPTFILLDGTWRQSARMLRLSRWLDNVATLTIPNHLTTALTNQYLVRKAHAPHQLATAQAAQLCLTLAGEKHNADVLKAYFDVFNAHYRAIRMNRPAPTIEAHGLLSQLNLR